MSPPCVIPLRRRLGRAAHTAPRPTHNAPRNSGLGESPIQTPRRLFRLAFVFQGQRQIVVSQRIVSSNSRPSGNVDAFRPTIWIARRY